MSKWAEFKCVLFGHDWTETGSSTCQLHDHTFDQYKKCGRCGLEHHIRQLCQKCWEKLMENEE